MVYDVTILGIRHVAVPSRIAQADMAMAVGAERHPDASIPLKGVAIRDEWNQASLSPRSLWTGKSHMGHYRPMPPLQRYSGSASTRFITAQRPRISTFANTHATTAEASGFAACPRPRLGDGRRLDNGIRQHCLRGEGTPWRGLGIGRFEGGWDQARRHDRQSYEGGERGPGGSARNRTGCIGQWVRAVFRVMEE